MSSPTPRFQTLSVPGRSALEAEQLCVDVLRTTTLDVRHVAPGRIGVARTFRPTWTIVLAVVLFPLGLLFLLVKNTEAGEVLVVDGPTGPVVTVPPVVSAEILGALERAFSGEAIPPPPRAVPFAATPAPPLPPAAPNAPAWGGDPATAAAPAPPISPPRPAGIIGAVPGLASPAAAPTPVAEAPPAEAPAPSVPAAVLRFPAGDLTIGVGETVTVGRQPTAAAGRCAALPGDVSTVSKTHAVVNFDGTMVAVTDLHSTNGTTVSFNGIAKPLVPDTASVVPAGATVTFGAVACEVLVGEVR